MRPRIGVTCGSGGEDGSFTLRPQYVEAVARAGGLPLLLPATEDVPAEAVLEAVDGVLLTGGGDVDPDWYGEEPRVVNGQINPVRDRFEIALCRAALRAGRPVLGICRGAQVLNVAAGGSLYQDLAREMGTSLQHAQKAPGWYGTHKVTVQEGTLLWRLVGATTLRVNSFHHQGVREIAPGFTACAHAADGVVEAIEGAGPAWALGIQWHPERSYKVNSPEFGLFKGFVEACRAARAQQA